MFIFYEANAMCGNWADCGGMVCGVGSGAPDGYCLARGKIDKNKSSQGKYTYTHFPFRQVFWNNVIFKKKF